MRSWTILGLAATACGAALAVACGESSEAEQDASSFSSFHDAPAAGDSPIIGDCPVFPANHIFNTPIGALPVDAHSADYIATIGSGKLHLDLGQVVDPTSAEYYGIPYNAVHGMSFQWPTSKYAALDTANYSWHPAAESDCGNASHDVVSPCTNDPVLPIPATPLVEGGINTTPGQQPDGDYHMLIVDSDSCRLWEAYHSFKTNGTWNIFGSAVWDLHKNDLRTAEWTSADAAGFPIMPLLLKASEASSGTIKHALRFTISSSKIAPRYVWPARHQTDTTANAAHPPMGQLFRLKASFSIPASANTQAKAILEAMKTYGMYLADGGSSWYVSGEPSADWQDATFGTVQAVPGDQFEAVDITAITGKPGFDPDSGAVP